MILALRMLLEGNSIRAVQRLLGIHRDTIMSAMVDAGERCKKFLETIVNRVVVADVQVDEIWAFVGMKEKTRIRKNREECFGDAWCYTAIERNTKMLLAWHVGKRTPTDTFLFAEKLDRATTGRFQLTTDGFRPYLNTIPRVLGHRVDFATLVKVYGTAEDDHRYSLGVVVDTIETVQVGEPDEDKICTSHVERSNKTLRMQIRRLTRLTDAHSKKWENHDAALGLFIAYYNFCRVHMTLKSTPAQEAGLTSETWSLDRLLAEASKV
jgi:IS1 family transposase